MAANVTRFVLLLLLALLAGAMVGIWVGYDPASLSAMAYVEQQQNAIRSLNTLLPVMGAVCILLNVILVILSKDPRGRYLLVASAVCLVGAALMTRFGNQPINAVVIMWAAQPPPANWAQLRDAWWHWHVVRTVAGIASLSLTLLAVPGARKAAA